MFLKPILFALCLFFMAAQASAHMPLSMCFDNGDNTITCEGGFSDGSSAAGVDMYVMSPDVRILLQGKMNENSRFTFDRPRGDFMVLFDAGADHRVQIRGSQIAQ